MQWNELIEQKLKAYRETSQDIELIMFIKYLKYSLIIVRILSIIFKFAMTIANKINQNSSLNFEIYDYIKTYFA